MIEHPWGNRGLVAELGTCFWSQRETLWSCCGEIRNAAGWYLHGLSEMCRAEAHKYADYRHYEPRMWRWLSARMCSFRQPDNTCQTLHVIAPSTSAYNVISDEDQCQFITFEFVSKMTSFIVHKLPWTSCKVVEHCCSASIFIVVNFSTELSERAPTILLKQL